MRGLTPVERYLLAAPIGFQAALPMEFEALERMSAVGRVQHLSGGDWKATDLGRLALRVCPVDEF